MAFDPEHAVPVVGLHQIDQAGSARKKSAAELGAERAAAESGVGGRLLAGIGHGFVNLDRGLHQAGLDAASALGVDGAERARQDYQKTVDDSRATDGALLATPAGRIGDMVGTAAATAPVMFVPGANTYAGAALTGAALGALEPTATGESRLANTASGAAGGVAGKGIGDAAGAGLKYVLGRVATRNAARQAEDAVEHSEGGLPPKPLGPPQRPPPPPPSRSAVPVAPPQAGRIVSGGDKAGPELTDDERRMAAEAAGILPDEVPPEASEVAHLVQTDAESAQRIHTEHPEDSGAFVEAVRDRNRLNASRGVAAADRTPVVGSPSEGQGNDDLTYLYQKLGPAGEHLKYGITSNPRRRYTKAKLAGGRLKILTQGTKEDMLTLERNLHETLPIGPEEGQKFYVKKQIQKGLKPPPYNAE